MYNIALVGNPNAGKSTIFNALTGERQHVGNWPGKTVAVKDGQCSTCGVTFTIIDLPGTYSLTAYSEEEAITRDYLIDGCPDAVVAVVDAGNLERNLYLVIQVIELGAPLIVVLNMLDMANARGLSINVDQLAARLDVPVVTTVATQGKGLDELKTKILEVAQGSSNQKKRKGYDKPLHEVHCPKCV
jgi:ferrous iron transport protein B